MKPFIYLDYNATAPIRPEVAEVMLEVMRHPYNPSSVHGQGRAAKAMIEQARKEIAAHLSCFAGELIFVSGGTEANNMALNAFPDRKLAVAATEHASVIKVREGAALLPVSTQGLLDMEALERWLQAQQQPTLVSVMLANNETGVIQPIKEIAALVHHYGGLLHCDAVQALGKISVDVTLLGADMMSFSAHKLGGAQGIGALFINQSLQLPSLLKGGGQELGRRAGTEPVAAIAGFAKAVALSYADNGWKAQLRGWLDALEADAIVLAGDASIVMGKEAPRLPNTTSLRMPNVSSQTQLMQYDLAGIAVSAGSACSSGRIEPSHVIRAMRSDAITVVDDVIRISGGWQTTKEDIAAFSHIWQRLMTKKLGNVA